NGSGPPAEVPKLFLQQRDELKRKLAENDRAWAAELVRYERETAARATADDRAKVADLRKQRATERDPNKAAALDAQIAAEQKKVDDADRAAVTKAKTTLYEQRVAPI